MPAGYYFEQRVKWTDTVGNNTGITVAEGQSINVNNIDSQMVSSLAVSSIGDYNVGAYAGDGGSASYDVVNGTNQYTTSASSYHVSGMAFDSSTVKYYNNRSLTNSYTESISAFPYIFLGFLRGSGSGTVDGRNMTTDWVLSRKYASTMPTVSNGTEQQGTAPVVYLKFDEGTGTTTYDSMTGLAMTFSGAPVWKDDSECISGKCLYFDGVDDYASVTAPSSVKSASRTISFWFRPTNFSATQGIVTLNSTNWYAGITTSNRFITSKQDSANTQKTYTGTSNTLLEDVWQHGTIVISNSGTNGSVSYYLNGVFQETDNYTDGQGANYGSTLRIARITTSGHFAGYVDEVRVYNYARTASQVLGEYNARGSASGTNNAQIGGSGPSDGQSLTDGLTLWWKMDESSWNGTASEVVDSSGKSVNGVAQCDALYDACASGVPSTTDGSLYGRAGAFNQDGQRLYADTEDFGTTERFESESIWLKPDTLPSSGNKIYFLVHMSTYDATGSNPTTSTHIRNNLYINSSGTVSFNALTYSGSTACSDWTIGQYLNQILTSTGTVSTGTWNHIAYTINWGTGNEISVKLYVNGVLEASFYESARSCYSNNYHTWIGKYKASGSAVDFDGNIDEYRRYKKVLTPDEVKALYRLAPGPVGSWNLDENTGTTAYNSSNSSNNGTLTNGPTWVPGKYGNAVNFDGSDDYITAATTSLPTGINQRSFGGWFNMTSDTAAIKVPFVYGNCSLGNDAFGVYLSSAEVLNFWGCGAGDFSTSTTLSINTWYHIMITYDTANVRVYVNGQQVGSTTAKTLSTATTGLFIGSDGTLDASNYSFPGYVDDVQVYNYALSAKQVKNIVNGRSAIDAAIGSPMGHPVIYFPFEEGTGTTANNKVDSSVNGTLTSMASPATSTSGWTTTGKVNRGLIFDGSNDYVSVADSTTTSITSAISISAWVNRTTSSTADGIVGKYVSASNRRSYLLGMNTSVVSFILSSNGTSATSLTGTTTIAAGQWYHIVGTYDGTTMKIYVNGKLDASVAYSSGIYDSTDVLRIGDGDSGFWSFVGTIDEVKIYNFGLTEDEVKMDYNQSSSVVFGNASTNSSGTSDNSTARSYCVPGDTSTCNSPVAEWRFDDNTGTSAVDISGNINAGTLTNGPLWSNGKFGSSVRLDGTDDHITVASSTSLNSGTSALTFSAWVKPYSTSDSYIALKFSTATPNGNGDYWLGIASSKWVAKTNGGTGSVSSIDNVSTNRWYYLTLVWTSGSALNFYVDGVYQGNDTTPGTVTNASQPLWIGRWDTAYFNGEIDSARLYTYARSQAQVSWEYNQGAPLFQYKLDECQGTTAYNSVNNGNGDSLGNNATITIGATGTNTSVGSCAGSAGEAWKDGSSGKYGSSIEFDGTDDVIDTSTLSSLNMTGQSYTISTWVKTTQATLATPYMIRAADGASGNVLAGFVLNVSANKISFDTWDFATNRVTSTTSVNNGQWHHVVGVYNSSGGLASLYVNGKLESSRTQSGSSGNVSKMLRLGSNINTSAAITQPYSGQLDDAMLFNYAMTAAQVRDLYNQGSASFK